MVAEFVRPASKGTKGAKRAAEELISKEKDVMCDKVVIQTKKFHQKCLTNYTTTGIFDINF